MIVSVERPLKDTRSPAAAGRGPKARPCGAHAHRRARIFGVRPWGCPRPWSDAVRLRKGYLPPVGTKPCPPSWIGHRALWPVRRWCGFCDRNPGTSIPGAVDP